MSPDCADTNERPGHPTATDANDRPGGGLDAHEVAALVHELNNPLAAITMTADLIGDDVQRLRAALDRDPADVRQLRHGLDEIGEAAEHLATAAGRLSEIIRRTRADRGRR